MSEDMKSVFIGAVIFILIVAIALAVGDSSNDAPGDPRCSYVGHC